MSEHPNHPKPSRVPGSCAVCGAACLAAHVVEHVGTELCATCANRARGLFDVERIAAQLPATPGWLLSDPYADGSATIHCDVGLGLFGRDQDAAEHVVAALAPPTEEGESESHESPTVLECIAQVLPHTRGFDLEGAVSALLLENAALKEAAWAPAAGLAQRSLMPSELELVHTALQVTIESHRRAVLAVGGTSNAKRAVEESILRLEALRQTLENVTVVRLHMAR